MNSFAETCARDKASSVVLTGLPFLVVVVVVTAVHTSPSSLYNLSEKGGKLLAAPLREITLACEVSFFYIFVLSSYLSLLFSLDSFLFHGIG